MIVARLRLTAKSAVVYNIILLWGSVEVTVFGIHVIKGIIRVSG